MSSLKLIALAVPLFAFAPTAVAAQQSPSFAPAADDKSDRMVCKSELRTGTRFKTRTCKSLKEWEAMREQLRRDAKDLVDRPIVNGLRSN